jgi:hypothetical protein
VIVKHVEHKDNSRVRSISVKEEPLVCKSPHHVCIDRPFVALDVLLKMIGSLLTLRVLAFGAVAARQLWTY